MTKSDQYIGIEREIVPAEILSKQVPEIKSKTLLNITHNTNVAVQLSNTESTLSVSWKEPADFTLRCYFVPRQGKGYLDNTLTCTTYATGLHVIAGYTTAVVTPIQMIKQITFSAAKWNCLKRLIFQKAPYNYIAYVSFTDLYGVSQSVRFIVRQYGTAQFLDIRAYRPDRSAALTIYLYPFDTANTELANNGSLSSPNIYFHGLDSPIEILFDCYNSIDDLPLGQLPVVDESIKAQVLTYIKNYSHFIEQDAKTFGISLELWASTLATAAAFSVSMLWCTATDWNNLEEVKARSLALAGALSNIGSGLFTKQATIPEHFVEQIESVLASNGDYNDLLLRASLLSVCDDIALETDLV